MVVAVAAAVDTPAQARGRAAGRDRAVVLDRVVEHDRAAARGRKHLEGRSDRLALLDRRRIGPVWPVAPEAVARRDRRTSAVHLRRAGPTLLRTGRQVD
jgi:hypothetical protein